MKKRTPPTERWAWTAAAALDLRDHIRARVLPRLARLEATLAGTDEARILAEIRAGLLDHVNRIRMCFKRGSD